jgi:hypothetical protein
MKTMKERKGGLTAYLQDTWGPGKSLQSIRTINRLLDMHLRYLL